MKRKFFYISLCILSFTIQLQAKAMHVDNVDANGYFIQIGAFSSIANVQRLQENLAQYDTFTEVYNGLTRVYVVNISNKADLSKSLVELRKIFPKAFVAKRPNLTQKQKVKTLEEIEESQYSDTAEGVLYLPQESKSESQFDQSEETQELIQKPSEPENNDGLNSDSIIKTRKTFL